MSEESKRLRTAVLASRERASATAEALGYRTDVPARARGAVTTTVDKLKASILDRFTTAKQTATKAAIDLGERAQPAVAAATVAAGEVARTVVDTARAASEVASSAVDAAQHTASDVAETVHAAADTARATVETVAEGVLDQVAPHEETLLTRLP